MWWLNEVGSWLIPSTVFGAIILLLGGLAVWFCREPIYRIRIIHWTFVACLLVPMLQQMNVFPKYSLNLWDETGSNVESLMDRDRTLESSKADLIPPHNTEVALLKPPLPFETMTSQDAVTVPREISTPAQQVAPHHTNDGLLFPIVFRALQIAYLAIIGYLFFSAAVGFARRSIIARYALPAPAELCNLFAAIAGSHTQNARLLVSHHVRSPVMWGLWRPTIVIPAALATEANSAQLRWCLAHEWSHVLRRDFSTLLLANLAKFVCFYQPGYWWMRRQMTLSQDFLADAFAARHGESSEDYASFLVSLARDRSQPKLAGTLGIRDRRSHLLHRINMLVKSARPLLQHENRFSAFAIILSALLIVGGLSVVRLSAAPLSEQPTATTDTAEKKPAKNAEQQTENSPVAAPLDAKTRSQANNEKSKLHPQPITYTGKVVDQKTGQPIAGATVEAKLMFNPDPKVKKLTPLRTTTQKTDEQGKFHFTLSSKEVEKKQFYLTVEIHHPQYEFKRKSLFLKNLAYRNPPYFSTIKLFPGKAISAVVLQPDGTPAVNTQVIVYSKSTLKNARTASLLYSQTDKNGRFKVIMATPGDGVVWVIPKNFSVLTHRIGDQRGDIGLLKLQKGTRLRGQVLDLAGKPVENVAVNLRRSGDGSAADEFLEANSSLNAIGLVAKTDKDGFFELTPMPPGTYWMVVDTFVFDATQDRAMLNERQRRHAFLPLEVTIREGQPNDLIKIHAAPHVLVRGHTFFKDRLFLRGFINGQHIRITSTLPRRDGWFEFAVPRGIEKVKMRLMGNQDEALLWRLKPGDSFISSNTADLGTLTEDLNTLEIVRFTPPVLLLKAEDERGQLLRAFKISSRYTTRPSNEKPFIHSNGKDVYFEKQLDGQRRSRIILPDQEITISIEKEGFTTEPQTVTLKEAEVRELIFVLKKTN